MEVKKIQEELAHLVELIDGWASSHDISGIERDLVLDKLRTLYEAVRFIRSDESRFIAAVPTAEDAVDVVSESEITINLEEILSTPILILESDATEPEEETLPDPSSESEFEPLSEILQREDTEDENIPNEAPSTPAAESVSVAAASQTDVPDPISEKRDMGTTVNSLFDLDDLVIRHREKRRVIMSLYETDPVQEPIRQSSRPIGTSVAAPHAEITLSDTADGTAVEDSDSASILLLDVFEEEEAAGSLSLETVSREAFVAEENVAGESEFESSPEPVDESQETLHDELSLAELPTSASRGAVLGDVIGNGMHTLGDSIARPNDMASEIRRKDRITDLRRAIGINDQFLLIRDLFGGDAEACEEAIGRLNAFDDLDDCIVFIAENYDWTPGSDGVRLLMELLERKLS